MSKKVFRLDQSKSSAFKRTPAGFLQAPAFLTRVGVLTYRREDGKTIRELRHPEDVFDANSIATLKCVPLTNNHPTRLVDTSNVKSLTVGYIGDVIVPDGEFLRADTVTIIDEKAIQDAESGKVELSCGYECDLEETPGEYEGEAYDVRQRNIIYNHVSIVDEGRAGPEVRLRLDSGDAILESIADNFINSKGEDQMEKITIDGVEFEVTPELKAVLEKKLAAMSEMDQKTADAEAKVVDAEAKVAASEAAADECKAKMDAAIAEAKKLRADGSDEKRINALAEEKMKVIKIASHVLGKEFKADGLTNLEIKKKVLETKGVDVKSKSDVYVEARFDAMSEVITEEVEAIQTFGVNMLTRTDSVKSADEARKASMERSKNAWKNK